MLLAKKRGSSYDVESGIREVLEDECVDENGRMLNSSKIHQRKSDDFVDGDFVVEERHADVVRLDSPFN